MGARKNGSPLRDPFLPSAKGVVSRVGRKGATKVGDWLPRGSSRSGSWRHTLISLQDKHQHKNQAWPMRESWDWIRCTYSSIEGTPLFAPSAEGRVLRSNIQKRRNDGSCKGEEIWLEGLQLGSVWFGHGENCKLSLAQQEDFIMVQVLLDMCGPFGRLRNTEHSEANFTW